MAAALECENSYFKENIFTTKYNPKTHKKLLLLLPIRDYIQKLWILLCKTGFPMQLRIYIIQYCVSVYDHGFRMPKDHDSATDFHWPKAVPLKYYTDVCLQKRKQIHDIKKSFFIHSKLSTTTCRFGKVVAKSSEYDFEDDEIRVYLLLGENIDPNNSFYIFMTDYRFFTGQTPVLWEDNIHLCIGIYYGIYAAFDKVDFICIEKESGHTLRLSMCEIINLGIHPIILKYATKKYPLGDDDKTMLQKYTESYG